MLPPSDLKNKDCIPKANGGCPLNTSEWEGQKCNAQKEPIPLAKFLEMFA